MRISDWSSDVCSSDLAACQRRPPILGAMNSREAKRSLRLMALMGCMGGAGALLPVAVLAAPMQDNVLVYEPPFFESAHPQHALDLVKRLPGFVQIGRASWRERVCMYV